MRLVAVTKYVSCDVIRALLAAGVQDLGENRVQQLVARAAECGAAPFGWPDSDEGPGRDVRGGAGVDASGGTAGNVPRLLPRWHMIGHLQRNKVRALLPASRIVHSVDSARLARELENHAATLDARVDVLLEVSIAGEESKEGVPSADVPALVTDVLSCPRLTLRGLMTMAPLVADPAETRPVFARLRALLEDLRRRGDVGPECRELSMGMSQDYEVAVEEGATLVRVGSALFGGLPSTDPRGGA